MVRRVKLGAAVIIVCMQAVGCGMKEERTPRNASVPYVTERPGQASTTNKNVSIYNKTYMYHDPDFNAKSVPFRIIKLDTKKTYKVPADQERMQLLEAAKCYFKELTRKQGLTKDEYSMNELEYVYELNDQLLYMPVYLSYKGGEQAGKEVLYNLILKEGKDTFELVGQTDRALLAEEEYPRTRLCAEKEVAAPAGYPVNNELYNNFFAEGERVENAAVRSYFIEQMKKYLSKEMTAAESDGTIRIGVVDLVKNARNAYFSLLEIVFYDTNNNIEKVKRYQVVDAAGTLEEVRINNLGVYNSVIEIAPDDYSIVSGQKLFVAGISEEEP